MHQGLTTKILICLVFLLSLQANGQLSNSKEIIETIDDIQVQDDSKVLKPSEDANKPKYDEEFGKKQEPKKEKEINPEENKVAEPEKIAPESAPEKERVERKEVKEEDQGTYEDQLEKNANRNKLENKELSPEDTKNFEVDPTVKPEPTTEPVVQSPQELKPMERPEEPDLEQERQEADKAVPKDIEEPTEEATEQTAQPVPAPVVEEPGTPIHYEPEPTGPVLVYENEKIISDDERKDLSEKTKVEIEEDPYIDTKVITQSTGYLKSFKDRRPDWTYQFELGATMYKPINYLSEINPGEDFETFYESADIPMVGMAFDFKKNFGWGAMSFGAGAAYFHAAQDTAEFALTVPTLRATLYLDTLFKEPYLVPYATVGYSYMMYNESDSATGIEFKGTTDNIYVGAGVLLQLDWLDPISDTSAYEDTGIENTFIFAEARTYLDQGIQRAEGDADFSDSTHLAAGIKLEF